MTSSLPDKPCLFHLKKQARKLLKQVRECNPHALTSVNENHPTPGLFSGLRDAQLVIARSYGFPGWTELSQAVEAAQIAEKNLPDKATLFIQLGCLQYNNKDTLRSHQRARRLLATFPDISEYTFHTALVANNARAVSEYLESDPTLALISGGPLAWPPLLYVIYSRVGEAENTQYSLSIVKALLKYGANPDSQVMLDETCRFTALTGAMGEGEQGVNQPPHQYADEIVELLLDAGANPNEGQGLYNTMFTESADKWLVMLLKYGLKSNDPLDWDDTGHVPQVSTLDYHLSSAVGSNRPTRVKLLLDAGANPNARNTYNGRAMHSNALLAGHVEIARLLKEKGAKREKLNVKDQFTLACVRGDNDAIASLLDAHPELCEDAAHLHAAAEHASVRVVKTLIGHGFDVNGQSQHGRTLLHVFALKNDAPVIQDLLSLGARTDIRDCSHNSTATGFAAYSASYDAMRLLLGSSDSLLDVVSCAYLERAKTLVEKTPASLHHRTEHGNTVLHVIGSWLHDEPEYDAYKALVEWLVFAGADINAINKNGQTPLQFNIANGCDILVELLTDYG